MSTKSKLADTFQGICDAVMNNKESKVETISRRIWLQNFAAVSATAGVVWACGSNDDKATAVAATYTTEQKRSDAATMNIALGLEHEAIALYTAAAGLGVWGTDASALAPTLKEVALKFAEHHVTHRNTLISAIESIKAETAVEPVAAGAAADYLTPYPGIAGLSGPSGLLLVLQVAAEREMNAANAYYSVIPKVYNSELIQALGGLSADESAHYGVLNAAALVHAALSGQTNSELTTANLVSGALPAFAYPRAVRS